MGGAAHVQVRLRDVKDGVPCVETLFEEAIKILGKAELIEDVRQFSHTVVLCLANTSRVCREEEGFIYRARVRGLYSRSGESIIGSRQVWWCSLRSMGPAVSGFGSRATAVYALYVDFEERRGIW